MSLSSASPAMVAAREITDANTIAAYGLLLLDAGVAFGAGAGTLLAKGQNGTQMPKFTRQEEEALVTRLENEGVVPEEYEDVALPSDLRAGRHGVRLTVRLAADAADLLGDLADAEYGGSLISAAEELLAEGLAAYAVRRTTGAIEYPERPAQLGCRRKAAE